MPEVEIPFGPWLPDAPTYKSPGCVVADNVIPTPGGYGPLRGQVQTTDYVFDQSRGAQQFFGADRSAIVVGGAPSALFVRRAGGLSLTDGVADTGADAWDFERFNAFLFASARNNPLYRLANLDTSDTFKEVEAPRGVRCARVGEFLMLGDVDGQPSRIHWSAYNDPAGDWTPSRLTQAGFADLDPEFGAVQRILGGRFALVFQERAVQRLTYVGPPIVWRAEIVSRDRGVVAPFSVANVGYQVFFLAQDGFYVTDGSQFSNIGGNKVNAWFFENAVDPSTVCAAVDWQNECVIWAFRARASDYYDRALIYSWTQQRWSSATFDAQWIFADTVEGETIESLDRFGSLSDVPDNLDSQRWRARNRAVATFLPYRNRSGKEAFSRGFSPAFAAQYQDASQYTRLIGPPTAAAFETGEFQPATGRRVFVSEVTPLIQAEEWDMRAALITRDHRGAETTGPLTEAGWGGFIPVRGAGEKMRVRAEKPAGSEWSDAQGIQVQYRSEGQR